MKKEFFYVLSSEIDRVISIGKPRKAIVMESILKAFQSFTIFLFP